MRRIMLRFLSLGLLTTAVTYALYLALLFWVSVHWAYGLALLSGLLLQGVGQARFVFEKSISSRRFWRSFLLYALYSLGYFAVFSWIVSWQALPNWIVPFVTIVICVPAHYGLSCLVFARDSKP